MQDSYLTYVVGVLIFAVRPAFNAGDWKTAAQYGALFGLSTYATDNLTNFATMKVWTLHFTLVDIPRGYSPDRRYGKRRRALAALKFGRQTSVGSPVRNGPWRPGAEFP
jgi:hypothetical protein